MYPYIYELFSCFSPYNVSIMVLQEHADISHLSGFHTPALARYFLEYDGSNLADLKEATQFAQTQNLPILTISGGKNLLLAFDEYPGLVIHNNSRGYEVIQNTKDKIQNG
jgi:UDP-N-acetylenolpyruvoylglucosamine reductase